MKEFDYTKWDSRPREMWVWDKDENKKFKELVVYVKADAALKALVVDDGGGALWYYHCAEIEQTRRMTNYELAHWLWEGTQVGEFREYRFTYFKNIKESPISSNYVYNDELKDKEIAECQIRVNGGEWKEPLIEAK